MTYFMGKQAAVKMAQTKFLLFIMKILLGNYEIIHKEFTRYYIGPSQDSN